MTKGTNRGMRFVLFKRKEGVQFYLKVVILKIVQQQNGNALREFALTNLMKSFIWN